MTLTTDELLQSGAAAGLGYVAGGPYLALLQGGLSLANALYSDPKPQVAPDRPALPQESYTSPEPVHGWSQIGAGRVGGLIAYASARVVGDNELLDMAIVVSRGAQRALGTSSYVWLNGERVYFQRYSAATNPEGGSADWYEPVLGSELGHNVFVDSFTQSRGLRDAAPVDGDLLFRSEGSGYLVEQRRVGQPTTIYTLPDAIASPNQVDLIAWDNPSEGDWLVDRDGIVWRQTQGINLLGQSALQAERLFSLAAAVEASGGIWEGIEGYSRSWAGRCRFYANFAADGTEGAELRDASRGFTYARSQAAGWVEATTPEWSTNHRLEDYSWIHFVVGRNRDDRLPGAQSRLPSKRRRPARLTSKPGTVFELGGRTDTETHPVAVAEWLLKQRGIAASHLSDQFADPLSAESADTADGVAIIKYRFRGAISDDQKTFELLRILEFCAAGTLRIDEEGKLWLAQLEVAPDRGMLSADDLLEGTESYDPQGRGLTANTARMLLRHVDLLHPTNSAWPLPDVVNSGLAAEDGQTNLDDLGGAEGITDYYQGQWRLKLYAAQLALRGKLTCRIEATVARRAWRYGDQLGARTGEWGDLAGYIESITDLFDGSLQLVLSCGDALDFGVGSLSDYRALSRDYPLALTIDNTPPAVPTNVRVEVTSGGLVVYFDLPPDSDYSHSLIRLTSVMPDVVREEQATASPFNFLAVDPGAYMVDVAHVDDQGNASAFSTAVAVVVRSIVQTLVEFAVPAVAIDLAPGVAIPDPGQLLPSASFVLC